MTAATPNLPAIATWDMPARIKYAQDLSNAGLLPDAYRKQPANVLYAVEWGIALGVEPMVAITEVHIIKGKPTASAGLMSALVRKAGHKLRTWVEHDDEGNVVKAVTTIIRADDPDFEFRATWTMDRARKAGLIKQNENYLKYPEQMLKARSVSECAREACKEALLGFTYVPEELGAEMNPDGSYVVTDARVEAGASVREAATASQEVTGVVKATTDQLRRLAKLMDEKGVTDKLGYLHLVHPDYTFRSAADLTPAQAAAVESALGRGEHLPPTVMEPEEAQASAEPASGPVAAAPDEKLAGGEQPPADADEPVEGDVVEDEPANKDQLRELGILMTDAGITVHTGRGSTKLNDEARFAWLSEFLKVPVEGSTKNLTHGQAQSAIDELKRLLVERAKRRLSLYKQIDESFTRIGITNGEDRFQDLSIILEQPIMNADDLTFEQVEAVAQLLEAALGAEQPRATWETMVSAAKQAAEAQQGEQQGGGF
ncbi:hypothetical protein SAMN05421874_12879 [Nonomuraea maritima]|uniref:RecT family protein n=1 Tax=Nonomuraea maritima TaxID=683260 RepID=A0A1G9MKJ1_9ACTN|nr:hypothetical protein [Nonomuraea maritima]SDL74788.1 hypothetical protein SAMN05421874_12879 [Nonomuraea maritima]